MFGIVCRSFISIIFSVLVVVQRLAKKVCRSFISIIVPEIKERLVNELVECRSFISIIVPLTRLVQNYLLQVRVDPL